MLVAARPRSWRAASSSSVGGEGDAELILALGGPPARWVVTGESSRTSLLAAGLGTAGPALGVGRHGASSVEAALHDDAWRVREMALKVVARHRLEDTLATVADLREDSTARVRAAASRALIRLAATGR